ncbi:MAG: hypothetical protein LWX07_11110 [Bacteroidetes bacterium]|nr:hypothetical protein [Bacteroidota bacterium]
MFQINKITALKPEDPELEQFITAAIIPGLLKWLHKNERAYNFISYFHSLGLSAEFIASASKQIPELKIAVDIALEISASRFYSLYPDNPKSQSYINYIFSLFRANSVSPVPDSVVVFEPAEPNTDQSK